jgi:hypothetical protein
LLCAAGCASRRIGNPYGERRGPYAGPSVNGTAVLSGMFKEAGHRVMTWPRLSPRLEDCQTIVWFPNDFDPPTMKQRDHLESWLYNEPGRTLVYVGRDFDALPMYWRKILPRAPPEQTMEVLRRAAAAQSEHDLARARMPNAEPADWFTLYRDEPHRRVKSLEGPWSEGIDAAQVDIELAARLEVPSESENDAWRDRPDYNWEGRAEFTTLLESEREAIVTRLNISDWGDSKLIIVNNGSFLLNLALVNQEHRKLAGKLVSECSPGRVAFLESGPGGPMIFDKEPNTNLPTGFQVFTVWPMGFIIMHLAVLGMLCCIAIFPIFGRPRELSIRSSGVSFADTTGAEAATVIRADFGKHIDALGELLELTEDRQYARNRVTYYHENVKRDSGASHRATQ